MLCRFVHSVHVPKFAPNVLVSGGGDPVLKMWDWMSGELLCDIPVGTVIEPLIAVRAPKSPWGRNEGSAEETEKRGRRGRRRGKGKGKADADVEQEEDETGPTVVAAEDIEGAGAGDEDVTMKDTANEDEVAPAADDTVETKANDDTLVLVIHRISSVDVLGQGRYLVFNAVGCVQ